MGKHVTKGDFEKMLHNPDDLTDDEDYWFLTPSDLDIILLAMSIVPKF